MKDQEMSEDLYSLSSQSQSYNDMDFGAGPSRPAPMPYDDPYSDSYGIPQDNSAPGSNGSSRPAPDVPENSDARPPQRSRTETISGPGRFNDRGRGRGRGGPRERGGRGRGRGRGRDHYGGVQRQGSWSDDRGTEIPRPLSPTSSAIARVTGQYGDGSMYAAPQQTMNIAQNGWDYTQSQQPNFNFNFGGYQQPFVQPHINPRFASAFAFNFGMYPQQEHVMNAENYAYGGYGQGSEYDYDFGTANHQGGSWPQSDNSGHSQGST